MANVIKTHKGLTINLKGRAEEKRLSWALTDEYALVPEAFIGVTPKLAVREGDKVLAGDALFVSKVNPRVRFASPVSGVVTAIERGERRKVLAVKVKANAQQEYRDFGKKDVSSLDGDAVVAALLEAGLFGYIDQLPYAISTVPDVAPKAIFVSALRDKPLAGKFEYELQGNEKDFQTGLEALAKIAKVYLGIGTEQANSSLFTPLSSLNNVEVNIFDGPCPVGNVGVQVNHLAPVNKGEVVWTIDPTAIIFFGRLFNTGRIDLRRVVAIAGSEMRETGYVELLVGTKISDQLYNNVADMAHVRFIQGNPLTGTPIKGDAWLGAHTSELCAIPEGDNVDELAGWIMPRSKQFSVSRSYLSWLFGKNKEYNLDARIKGGARHMIMSGEYDKVLPMDIFGEYLIKAIIAEDIDKQEQLGIYEVSPEDFALAEFVDSSKLPLQQIVRKGLDILRKENS